MILIRRQATAADGLAGWLLIPQTEHAHLASALATHWLYGPRPVAQPALITATFHHDEGWAEWEAEPEVDPESGFPLDFTEMPTETALAIWSRSIHQAAPRGQLVAWLVAQHFMALLAASSAAATAAGEAWLGEQHAQCEHWLGSWIKQDERHHTPDVARRTLGYLQMFDALSLWFCQSETSDFHRAVPRGGQPVVFEAAAQDHVVVRPWPFAGPQLVVEVRGRWVKGHRYADRRALAATPKRNETLLWRLTPGR